MFDIAIKTEFSSAHNLREYLGKCEALHGHNWKVEVKLSSEKLDKIGMVMDFTKVKEITRDIIQDMDHKYLNDIPYFSAEGGSASGGKNINPTSENIAKFIFDKVNQALSKESKSVVLKSVTIWENDNSYATYSKS